MSLTSRPAASREAPAARVSVLLFGPSLSGNPAGYGGGKGGIVSALRLVKDELSGRDVDITYVPYGIRSLNHLWWLLLPVRLISDLAALTRNLGAAGVVHIAANSGPAIVRSLGAVILARLFGKRVLLDVRGDGLDAFSTGTDGLVSAFFWRVVLASSDRVLVQRKRTAQKLSIRYPDKVLHQPNPFPDAEIPEEVPARLGGDVLRLVFVGYCYRDKGVFDIVEGCMQACERGLQIELTLIGQEHEDFSGYLDRRAACDGLAIRRAGTQSRAQVLRTMNRSDVFVFPTYHQGEGHPNVLNEAMAHELTLIVTDHGSIGEILDDDSAYFVEPRSPGQIADVLCHVDANRVEARRKAEEARHRLMARYSASHVLGRLRQTYIELT